ncbi:Protein of unknown function [Pyronema omphalodes CBS 100304]|uniref:Uncharacterized protein n=1 Tax=Pyronema omphalodes (strain CBS 100304) TaxID=1076935 RepID=U4L8V3_PYROM|nr:Protein of unknown function [Pyronema omphalodes CBS 100304]
MIATCTFRALAGGIPNLPASSGDALPPIWPSLSPSSDGMPASARNPARCCGTFAVALGWYGEFL